MDTGAESEAGRLVCDVPDMARRNQRNAEQPVERLDAVLHRGGEEGGSAKVPTLGAVANAGLGGGRGRPDGAGGSAGPALQVPEWRHPPRRVRLVQVQAGAGAVAGAAARRRRRTKSSGRCSAIPAVAAARIRTTAGRRSPPSVPPVIVSATSATTSGRISTDVRSRFTRRAILESIFYPSDVVDDRFALWTFQLRSGESKSGIIVSEDDQKVLFKNGADAPISDGEVTNRFTQEIRASLMPDLRDVLTQPQIRDIVAFLQAGAK